MENLFPAPLIFPSILRAPSPSPTVQSDKAWPATRVNILTAREVIDG